MRLLHSQLLLVSPQSGQQVADADQQWWTVWSPCSCLRDVAETSTQMLHCMATVLKESMQAHHRTGTAYKSMMMQAWGHRRCDQAG